MRYYSKRSECDKCEKICPTDAIKTQEGALAIMQQACIGCGGCVGVCPTEALELPNLNIAQFFFEQIKKEEPLSCKTNFVCLAALHVEYLVAFGLVRDLVLDTGHCKECDIASRCYPQIEANIDEANYVLQTIGGHKVEAKELGCKREEQPDRREFFSLFTLKGAMKVKSDFEEELESLENPSIALDDAQARAIRDKVLPNRRKLLFTLLKKVPKPQSYKYLENEFLTFTSAKRIDESCDNCSICYRICPTEALSSDAKGSRIFFDPLLCVRCHLCHDVCEKESITLAPYFDTKEFFEPQAHVLAQFIIARCEDCGNFFTYFGGEKVCQRCKIEEEEAKSLWGIE